MPTYKKLPTVMIEMWYSSIQTIGGRTICKTGACAADNKTGEPALVGL